MVLNHHECAIDNDAEIQRAQAEEICRNSGDVHANESEQE